MDEADLERALELIGLSGYQAEAYRTLVERGTMTATDLATATSISTSRIYDVLRDLEEAGYVDRFEQDAVRARARPPDEVMADLRDSETLLGAAAEAIEDRWEQPDTPTHDVSVLERAETVTDRLREAIRAAGTSLMLAAPPTRLVELRESLETASERGVVVRVVTCPSQGPGDGDVAWLADVATEVRLSRETTPLLLVADHTVAAFDPLFSEWGEFALIVENYVLAFHFVTTFWACIWNLWDTAYRAPGSQGTFVSLREFVYGFAPYWDDGLEVAVSIEGVETATERDCTVRGTVVDVRYPPTDLGTDGPPAFGQLSSYVSLLIDTGSSVVDVGGWGAVDETVAAHRIELEAVEFPRPDPPTNLDPNRRFPRRGDA